MSSAWVIPHLWSLSSAKLLLLWHYGTFDSLRRDVWLSSVSLYFSQIKFFKLKEIITLNSFWMMLFCVLSSLCVNCVRLIVLCVLLFVSKWEWKAVVIRLCSRLLTDSSFLTQLHRNVPIRQSSVMSNNIKPDRFTFVKGNGCLQTHGQE